MYLLVNEEEINELPKRDNVGVPRKLRLGDGTLLYKSMDCLIQGYEIPSIINQSLNTVQVR